MSKRILLIDDLRFAPADRIARTFDEGISYLRNEGPWDVLLLDHDLGDPNPKKTGYDILNWLEERPEYIPADIKLVTMDPVGRLKMQPLIERLLKMRAELPKPRCEYRLDVNTPCAENAEEGRRYCKWHPEKS